MDDLGLVEAIDSFREGIVVAVADTANRGLNTCFGQALSILDREVLAASVAVMHEPATVRRPLSISAFFTHSCNVCGIQPILVEIETTAAQREACSQTIIEELRRTASQHTLKS